MDETVQTVGNPGMFRVHSEYREANEAPLVLFINTINSIFFDYQKGCIDLCIICPFQFYFDSLI